MLSCQFCENHNTFSYRTTLAAASDISTFLTQDFKNFLSLENDKEHNWNKPKFLTNFIKFIKLVPVQCYLKTLWTRMYGSKLYEMLFKRVQTTLHMKNSVQCCLNTFRTTFHRSKLYAMSCEKLQTTLHKEKSCAMLS